ncbi:hypothetical protein GCK72_021007 [Caenorhabditis remanei]|uniref:Uncharacterized protein n=1 Tax=Caenorhabditis remanei TaxID=31234 RepID=A0A6A5GIQ1_CAERE|nr:hypothetical protein GCK72_021007 [Caenorhabditis remanei]KAF1754445.1 hypothetical protein GCK72_021007 [Caenorhabditis remanei]
MNSSNYAPPKKVMNDSATSYFVQPENYDQNGMITSTIEPVVFQQQTTTKSEKRSECIVFNFAKGSGPTINIQKC